MKKYSIVLFAMLAMILAACRAKNDVQQDVPLTEPAMSVTITGENCPSMEVQVGIQVMWINGGSVTLPIMLEELDVNGNIITVGKSEINSDNQFSVWFEHAGIYHLYCSENRDVYGTITVK